MKNERFYFILIMKMSFINRSSIYFVNCQTIKPNFHSQIQLQIKSLFLLNFNYYSTINNLILYHIIEMSRHHERDRSRDRHGYRGRS